MPARLAALLSLAAVIAGCGGSAGGKQQQTAPPPPELVFFHRTAMTADPWVDELDVRIDGTVQLRLPRGGAGGNCRRARLDPRSLAHLKARVQSTSFREDSDQSAPDPGSYSYVVRRGTASVSASGGHVPARLRPLIGQLDKLTNRLMVARNPSTKMGCA